MALTRKLKSLMRPKWVWAVLWMRLSGRGRLGRIATRFATWATPPYKGRCYLATLTPKGFVSPTAYVDGVDLRCGKNVFIGDGVVFHRDDAAAGAAILGDRVHIHANTTIELGQGGSLIVADDTHVQPHCLFAGYLSPIRIGKDVQIAPYCRFYPYDHHFAEGKQIIAQPLKSKGGIVIEDDAWLGVGVTVLDGVRIGKGAVIGAGSVVMHSIPDGAIALGNPARVVRMRSELSADYDESQDADEDVSNAPD